MMSGPYIRVEKPPSKTSIREIEKPDRVMLPSMTNRQVKDIVPKAWAAARRSTALRAA
jgi:hypothetical protein